VIDETLRLLEREGRNAPIRSVERWRWRSALLRLGRRREAGLELGDRVREIQPGWNRSGEGTVFSLTKTTVKVQFDIGEKLCVRPRYHLPATRSIVLVEPGLGEYWPW